MNGSIKLMIVCGLLVVFALFSSTGQVGAQAGGVFKAGYMTSVTDNDKAWGQSAREVLDRVSRDFKPGGIKVEFNQNYGVAPPDYPEVGDKLFALGVKAIFVLDEGRGPEMYQLAMKHKDRYVAASGIGLVDTTPPGTTELPENMLVQDTGIGMAQQHYLLGILAGKMTKNNKVGFIGGAPFPSVVRKGLAFVAGVKDANPQADVSQWLWAGKWGDPDLGRKLAIQQINYGVDIMLQFGDGTGLGAMLECRAKKVPVFGCLWPGLIDEFPEVCVGATNSGGDGYTGLDGLYKRVITAIIEGAFEENFGGKVIKMPLSGGPLGFYPLPELNPRWMGKISMEAMATYRENMQIMLDGSFTLEEFDEKIEEARKIVKVK